MGTFFSINWSRRVASSAGVAQRASRTTSSARGDAFAMAQIRGASSCLAINAEQVVDGLNPWTVIGLRLLLRGLLLPLSREEAELDALISLQLLLLGKARTACGRAVVPVCCRSLAFTGIIGAPARGRNAS